METIEKLIGKKVKEARKEAKLTQSELAKDAKTSLTTINRLEKGKQFPNRSTRLEIAKALNKKEGDLFLGLSDSPATPVHQGSSIEKLEAKIDALDAKVTQAPANPQDLEDAQNWRALKAKLDKHNPQIIPRLKALSDLEVLDLMLDLGLQYENPQGESAKAKIPPTPAPSHKKPPVSRPHRKKPVSL